MDINEKSAAALQGDMSLRACAIRLMAARLVTGFNQQDFAAASGVKKTTYNNMETGRAYPSRDVMRYLFRGHRIDFNFMLHGDFAQLPSDVQDQLFARLPAVMHEWDRRDNSGSSPAGMQAKLQ
jgi:DNA-binding XRE family transcriptional regulator